MSWESAPKGRCLGERDGTAALKNMHLGDTVNGESCGWS
jgi:hypothetical protein